MPPISSEADMKRVRAAVAEVRRQRLAAPVAQLVDQIFARCEALERDLAGAEMRVAAIQAQVRQQAAGRDHLFEAMPVACVELDGGGIIVSANPAAATLLNTSRKHLEGRLLLHFADDRQGFQSFIQNLSLMHLGIPTPFSCNIRPREQACVRVECTATSAGLRDGSGVWVFLQLKQAPILRKLPGTASIRGDAETHQSA